MSYKTFEEFWEVSKMTLGNPESLVGAVCKIHSLEAWNAALALRQEEVDELMAERVQFCSNQIKMHEDIGSLRSKLNPEIKELPDQEGWWWLNGMEVVRVIHEMGENVIHDKWYFRRVADDSWNYLEKGKWIRINPPNPST